MCIFVFCRYTYMFNLLCGFPINLMTLYYFSIRKTILMKIKQNKYCMYGKNEEVSSLKQNAFRMNSSI